MSAHDFRLPTPEAVLEVLKRLALHFPRSKQVAYLDILAADYAKALGHLRMGDIEDAAQEVIATCRHFPTVSELLAAHQDVNARRRAENQDRLDRQAPQWTEEQHEISRQRAKDVWNALKTGRKPEWMN
jgi:O-methyltransferase involved in polyketide biosynthesis